MADDFGGDDSPERSLSPDVPPEEEKGPSGVLDRYLYDWAYIEVRLARGLGSRLRVWVRSGLSIEMGLGCRDPCARAVIDAADPGPECLSPSQTLTPDP